VTPTIPDIGDDTVAEIAAKRSRVVEQVQSGEFSIEILENGTFTVTNLGLFPIDSFTPVIDPS
jgi:pyruvate dehydrogenase E2 component (dihydrolipoamide acetyltransferase)